MGDIGKSHCVFVAIDHCHEAFEPIVGDVGRSHCVFAAVDHCQVEH